MDRILIGRLLIITILLFGHSVSGADTNQSQDHVSTFLYSKPKLNAAPITPILKIPSIAHSNFVDQNGNKVVIKDFFGKVLILNFIFTQCSNVCPLQTDALRRVQTALKNHSNYKDLVFLSISIDPETDTPSRLKQFSKDFHVDESNWYFLTAKQTVVNQFIEDFGVGVKKTKNDSLDHRPSINLIDQQGRLIQQYSGNPVDVDRLTTEISAFLQIKN